jgi:hypothetical protein
MYCWAPSPAVRSPEASSESEERHEQPRDEEEEFGAGNFHGVGVYCFTLKMPSLSPPLTCRPVSLFF